MGLGECCIDVSWCQCDQDWCNNREGVGKTDQNKDGRKVSREVNSSYTAVLRGFINISVDAQGNLETQGALQ